MVGANDRLCYLVRIYKSVAFAEKCIRLCVELSCHLGFVLSFVMGHTG